MPPQELETIELNGSHELIVDGDMILTYSATLEVELKPLVRGLRNLYCSGEGCGSASKVGPRPLLPQVIGTKQLSQIDWGSARRRFRPPLPLLTRLLSILVSDPKLSWVILVGCA